MRVLFLTHRLPYAPNRGDRTRAHHILRVLAGRADVDLVSLVHDNEEQGHTADLSDLVASVTTLRVRLWHQGLRSARAFATRTPLTHALLDSPGMTSALGRVVASHRPDVVLAYCSGMARFALEPPLESIPFVLDMVDVDSEKWRDLSSRSSAPRRWVYAREARRLADFEKVAALRSAATLVVNEREAEALRRLAPAARVLLVGNGVDYDALRPSAPPVDEPRVVFSGVMDYEPNEQAAIWMAGEVWPLVLERVPAARLVLVGANPTRAVRQLERADPTVSVTGTVDDVRAYLWGSAVSVAPLWTARGVQNKVLEAVAAGLPCVVTPAVAGGLPQTVLAACVVAADARAFATAIVALLEREPSARREMASRANIVAHGWTAQLSALWPVLEEVSGRK